MDPPEGLKRSYTMENRAKTLAGQAVRWGTTSVTYVKKQMDDGDFCKKCKQVSERLTKEGLDQYIGETVVADVKNPSSAGMELAREHSVDTAPFFIVHEEGHPDTVLKTYHQAKKLLHQLKALDEEERGLEQVHA